MKEAYLKNEGRSVNEKMNHPPDSIWFDRASLKKKKKRRHFFFRRKEAG